MRDEGRAMNDASDPRAVPDDRARDADVLAAYFAASGGGPTAGPARTAAGFDADAPRPETRAAILAAAARAVQARPVAVGATAAPRGAPTRFRYRAPLALAASLLVGTVAWQLAAQFDEQPAPGDSTATAPAVTAAATPAPGPSSIAVSPPEAAPPSPSAPAASTAASSPTNADAATASPQPHAAPVAAEKAVAARSAEAVAPAPASRADATAPPAAGPVPAPARPAPQSAPAPPAPSTTPAAPIPGAVAPSPASGAASALTESAVPALRARPPAAIGAAESKPASDPAAVPSREEQVRTQPVERRLFNEAPPVRPLPAWLERIAELRRAGRDAEAEVELQALRRAYPQAQIPPELLAPQPR
jgi:hypothetical protein